MTIANFVMKLGTLRKTRDVHLLATTGLVVLITVVNLQVQF